MKNKKISLQHTNWARIVLGGAIIASKVWDDHAIWNVDFCLIFPEVPVEDLYFSLIRCELERYFLDAMQYNVNVKASSYVKSFYKIKDLTHYTNQPWALAPIRFSQISKIMVYYN